MIRPAILAIALLATGIHSQGAIQPPLIARPSLRAVDPEPTPRVTAPSTTSLPAAPAAPSSVENIPSHYHTASSSYTRLAPLPLEVPRSGPVTLAFKPRARSLSVEDVVRLLPEGTASATVSPVVVPDSGLSEALQVSSTSEVDVPVTRHRLVVEVEANTKNFNTAQDVSLAGFYNGKYGTTTRTAKPWYLTQPLVNRFNRTRAPPQPDMTVPERVALCESCAVAEAKLRTANVLNYLAMVRDEGCGVDDATAGTAASDIFRLYTQGFRTGQENAWVYQGFNRSDAASLQVGSNARIEVVVEVSSRCVNAVLAGVEAAGARRVTQVTHLADERDIWAAQQRADAEALVRASTKAIALLESLGETGEFPVVRVDVQRAVGTTADSYAKTMPAVAAYGGAMRSMVAMDAPMESGSQEGDGAVALGLIAAEDVRVNAVVSLTVAPKNK